MSSAGKYNWDYNFCFHIDDFQPDDSLIIDEGGSRVKGQVVSVDKKKKLILYRRADNSVGFATLNDVIYLDDYKHNWLNRK